MPKNVKGGAKLKRWIREARKNARKSTGTEVGFFTDSRYPDRTSVALIAQIHEYGVGVPERPFFRPATERAKPGIRRIVRGGLKGRSARDPLDLPRDVATKAGEHLAQEVRHAIDTYRDADTGERALVDTGLLRDSVQIRVGGRAAGSEGSD